MVTNSVKHDGPDDVYLVIWNSVYKLPNKCIIYNFDPFCENVLNLFTQLLQRSPNSEILAFVDYCDGGNRDIITNMDFNYELMPYGYSEYHVEQYDKYLRGQKQNHHKSIDLLFYGNMSVRRNQIAEKINNLCRRKNYRFVIRNNNLYDEDEKASIIERSKIVLSFASSDAKSLRTNDLCRLSPLICNKAFIITEFIGDNLVEPTISEYVVYTSSIDEMLQKIEYYLDREHTEERLEMAKIAKERFYQDFNLERDLMKIIKKYYEQ